MFSLLAGVPLLAVMALGISQATTPHTEGEDSQICALKICFNITRNVLDTRGFKKVQWEALGIFW